MKSPFNFVFSNTNVSLASKCPELDSNSNFLSHKCVPTPWLETIVLSHNSCQHPLFISESPPFNCLATRFPLLLFVFLFVKMISKWVHSSHKWKIFSMEPNAFDMCKLTAFVFSLSPRQSNAAPLHQWKKNFFSFFMIFFIVKEKKRHTHRHSPCGFHPSMRIVSIHSHPFFSFHPWSKYAFSIPSTCLFCFVFVGANRTIFSRLIFFFAFHHHNPTKREFFTS